MLQTAWHFAMDRFSWLSAFTSVVYDVFLQVRAHLQLIYSLHLHPTLLKFNSVTVVCLATVETRIIRR